MTNRYSLESLRADLDKQYAPFVLELDTGEVTLRNLLRMPSNERQAVFELIEDLDTDTEKLDAGKAEQTLSTLQEVLRAVTADKKGDTLVELIGDDLLLGMNIFELWMEATQPGEAGNSPDSSTSTASA